MSFQNVAQILLKAVFAFIKLIDLWTSQKDSEKFYMEVFNTPHTYTVNTPTA